MSKPPGIGRSERSNTHDQSRFQQSTPACFSVDREAGNHQPAAEAGEMSEIAPYNEAIADFQAETDDLRALQRQVEAGEFTLTDAQKLEILNSYTEDVEFFERWRTALQYQPIPVTPQAKLPKPAQRSPAVAYARVGPLGIVSCAAAPNSSVGSTVERPGNWRGR
jgi:hypothetical protein